MSILATMGLFGKSKDDKPKKITPKVLWEQYYKATQEQQWAVAVDALRQLAKRESEKSKISMKRGDALQRMGSTKEAVAAYHEAARATVANGFAQKALAIYKIILRLDPRNEQAQECSKEILDGIDGAPQHEPQAVAGSAAFEGYGSLDMPSAGAMPAADESPEEPAHVETELPPIEELTAEPEPEAGPQEPPVLEQTAYADESGPSVDAGPLEGLEQTSQSVEDELESLSKPVAPETPAPEAAANVQPEASKEEQEFSLPSVFSFLMPDEQEAFIAKARLVPYGHGESIVREGETGDTMYIIRQGTVRVVTDIMGREVELALLGPGDFFGEVAFLTGRPRTASVVALGDVEIYAIDKPLLQETIDLNPLILDSLVELYHSRAQDTVEKIKG